jgi:RHH-type proline utilization regulon transcriptional repressor/proline dehydrogenase/delta 1-pyrroline-5-carboxylate dehydrogenase
MAAEADINLTLDAEEADRLVLSLELLDRWRASRSWALARPGPGRAGLPEARPEVIAASPASRAPAAGG